MKPFEAFYLCLNPLISFYFFEEGPLNFHWNLLQVNLFYYQCFFRFSFFSSSLYTPYLIYNYSSIYLRYFYFYVSSFLFSFLIQLLKVRKYSSVQSYLLESSILFGYSYFLSSFCPTS